MTLTETRDAILAALIERGIQPETYVAQIAGHAAIAVKFGDLPLDRAVDGAEREVRRLKR